MLSVKNYVHREKRSPLREGMEDRKIIMMKESEGTKQS